MRQFLFATAAALLLPCTAHAYDFEHDASGSDIRWPGSLVLEVDARARDVDPQDVMAAVQRAAAHWSQVAGVSIQVKQEHDHGAPGYDPSKEENNRSEVIFVDDDWEYDDSVVATTLVTSDSATHQILDTDILVNEAQHKFAILPDDSQAGQGLRDDLEGALTHELGHALGLAHNNTLQEATMYPSTEPGQVSKRKLSDDDVAGVQQLYGTAADPKSDPMPNAGCNAGVGADGMLALLAIAALLLRRKARTAAVAMAAVASLAVPMAAHAESRPVVAKLEGQVLRAGSYWKNGRIYTDVTVQVTTCQTGECSATVTYRVPGGTVGRICQQLGDIRVPAAGERVAVTLVRAPDGALRPLIGGATLRPRSSARPAPRTNAP